MFGIRSGPKVLRRYWIAGFEILNMSENEDHEPLVRESNIEIDDLLQEVSVDFSDYSLIVYELDDNEVAEITIKKLQSLY